MILCFLLFCFLIHLLSILPPHAISPVSYTTIRPSRTAFGNIETTYFSLYVYYYLMFDLTFTFSFLLIKKLIFYHSPKLYRTQATVNESTQFRA